MMHWFYLAIAIFSEVIGTTALKAAEGFTRLGPSLLVVVGYLTAFFFLGLSLRVLPVGIAYALWAALGMVLIVISGWLFFGEQLDGWAKLGLALIIAGVVLVSGVSGNVRGAPGALDESAASSDASTPH
ncbi:MAG: multidrug efflux SMR transporter [Xanthomonadaceae bacterium]|nr:multidrug efflux SMR transporter [Xanthomonadaceae bacterium]